MTQFTERYESWYKDRMTRYDTDATFRGTQPGIYRGGRAGYLLSVLAVVETKISKARAKEEAAVLSWDTSRWNLSQQQKLQRGLRSRLLVRLTPWHWLKSWH